MVFGGIVTSPRGNLSLQQSLELANVYLENASRAQDPDIALVLCHDTEVSLSQLKKGARNADDQILREGIATTYIDLGRVLESRGHHSEAQASYKKAEKLGGVVQDRGRFAQPSKSKGSLLSPTKDSTTPIVNTPATSKPLPPPSSTRPKRPNRIATIPRQIFAENVRPPSIVSKLPDADERLINTPQLACCLSLLKDTNPLDDTLEPMARHWLQAVENDADERERLKILATDVIRTYKRDELKDAKTVAEVVSLAPAIDKDTFRDLLIQFYNGIDHSGLLAFHQLYGLAQLIQGADTDYLDADDLVKILRLLSTRLQDTHRQSPQHLYQLTLTASYVLDAMADTKVTGLDREKLHEPLLSYLDALKASSDPYLVYEAAYAYQALLCVPDDETLWQATLRRTGKVIQGVSGLVSAVKGLDLNGFMAGLKDIQQGLAGVVEVAQVVKSAYEDASSLMGGGLGFLEGLKEGLSFKRKCAWYPALRGVDALIRDGEFATLKRLVCEAPCRLDPAFQWGVCQRLGEIAVNPMWDTLTRRSAVAFLGEMYRNDDDWGQQASVKEWILIILSRLSSPESALQYAESLLQELEATTSPKKQAIYLASRAKDPTSYPLQTALPALASPSLLDRVQNKPDVEGALRQLRKHRLKERSDAVYIRPQAKASLQAPDEERFSLMDKVEAFLSNDHQKVFLLLGDSGAGKSTFNLNLECDLWHRYKKNTGRIPLHINLPAIDKPEQDMITKQLRKSEFTEPEIRELKLHRKFILICDGYDESQQTHNLYMSNRLNQPGEWNAQMLISCRSEFLGVDYRDRFQPRDRNRPSSSSSSPSSSSEVGQFQEAVFTPFTPDQVHDYIKQYVLVHQPLWEVSEYEQALELIPSLKDLVKNPFLMTPSLEVLPRMVDPGENLSATRITRVALYDQFIEHWLERGKKRLSDKDLSPQAKSAFENLIDEGFTQNGIDFLKKLAVAIYKEQGGQPIVKYSRFKDEISWKAAFFSREDEKQLLREACPLTRSGNQHRFIHRSLLEYGVALAVFDPHEWREKAKSAAASAATSTTTSGRRGSTSSAYSFHIHGFSEQVEEQPIEQGPDPHSPLVWRYFLNEPSVLQFLSERAQQEPIFKQQLLDFIQLSKKDVTWRTAAANAITILVRAGELFHGADLRGVQIPGAELSYGMFDSAQFQGADLRQVQFKCAWLRQANLTGAKMAGVQFGELPSLQVETDAWSCAYSPDGQLLAVTCDGGDVKVYTTSNWEFSTVLSSHSKFASKVVFSPRGDRIATSSWDMTVRIWDTETKLGLLTLTGHSDDVNGVAFSPDGDTVASCSADLTVRVWDARTAGNQLQELTGHTKDILCVVYSPNGQWIASGGGDNTIRLWDTASWTTCRILENHSESVWCIGFSPQGNMMASSSRDRTIRLWDVETGDCCRVLTGHSGSIRSIAYSPLGDLIASCGDDNTVRIWDTETGACRQVLTGHFKIARCVAFSPKGDLIASSSEDETVRLWHVGEAAVPHQDSTDHSSGIMGIQYLPKTGQIASGGRDATIVLWDPETGDRRQTLRGHQYWVQTVASSPLEDLIASASEDDTVRLWEVETGVCRHVFNGHTDSVFLVAYSPRGDQIASASREETVMIWDVNTGSCRHALSGHTKRVYSLAYSPDGHQIATGSGDKTIRLWDAETGICLHILKDHSGAVVSLVYSPRGHRIFSGSWDECIGVWDAKSGICLQFLVGHRDNVNEIACSPSEEDNQVASVSDDKTVRLWEVISGDCLHVMEGHTDEVVKIKYAPKGDLIASGSVDKTVRLWHVASGQCRAVIQDFHGRINDIAWDPSLDMYRLVTSCEDGSMRMWQVTEEDGGDSSRVYLRWNSKRGVLAISDVLIQDVNGLSALNRQFLKQRGAIGEPALRLREMGKKVIGMASMVSKLRQASSGMMLESSSAGTLASR